MKQKTNRYHLPEPFCLAIDALTHKVSGDISVSQLIGPSLKHHLEVKYADEIVYDYKDFLWILYGSIGHEILQKAGEALNALGKIETEKHGSFLFPHPTEDGEFVTISYTYDLWIGKDNRMTDYKFTSIYAVRDNLKHEWEAQVNIYAYARWRETGEYPDILDIEACLRDWSKKQAKKEGYPDIQRLRVEARKWSVQEVEQYISDRLIIHFVNEPTCTDSERWIKGGEFPVHQFKKGTKEPKKHASRLFKDEDEAYDWARDQGSDFEVLGRRLVTFPRCEEYCEGVNAFCPLYKKYQENKTGE